MTERLHNTQWRLRTLVRALLVMSLVLAVATCTPRKEKPPAQSLLVPGKNQSATGAKGMVTGTHADPAVRAGLEALKQGGSAADAALVTALGQIAPVPGGWITCAGILTMMYYDASTQQVHSLNAAWNVPRDEVDPLSIPDLDSGTPSGRAVLVPGFMAGVQAAHSRFGMLPWQALFEPAIGFAEEGFRIDAFHAYLIEDYKAVLTRLPETRYLFTGEGGEFYGEGDLFRQPELANTLRAVAAQGADYMYTGPWAEKFLRAVQDEGGKITLEDMAAYKVVWSDPVHTTYREYEVYGPGVPAVGGVNAVEAFNLLEAADWSEYGNYATSPKALFWFMQTFRAAHLSYLSPAEAAALAPGKDLSLASRQSKETAQWIWQQMRQGNWPLAARPVNSSGEHSAAVVAVDQWGNVAAVVHTSNALFWGETGIFVDGVHVPDAGSHQQHRMAMAGPGNRLPDPTNPLIILRDGQPVLASSCIGQVHVETMQRLVNIVDYGTDPRGALEAPLLLSLAGSPSQLVERVAEGQFDPALLDAVRAMGQPVEEVPLTTEHLVKSRGYWVGILIDPERGTLEGAAPTIFGGTAVGY